MTVKELIEKLQQFWPGQEIKMMDTDLYVTGIGDVDVWGDDLVITVHRQAGPVWVQP